MSGVLSRRVSHFFASSLVFVLSAFASRASAQVNTEMLRPDRWRAGWSVGAEASIALARGNIELFDVGGGARLQWQTLAPLVVEPGDPLTPLRIPFVEHRVFVSGNARYAEVSDKSTINQAFAHLRWTAMWHERVGSDLFVQHQSNEFLRLRRRTLGGVGVRIEPVHFRFLQVSVGSAYMFEAERIRVADGASDPPNTDFHRWSNYLIVRSELFDGRLLLQDSLFVQPRFDAFEDVRVLNDFEVKAKVIDRFTIGTTFSVLHDSRPPTTVKPTDLRLATTVTFALD